MNIHELCKYGNAEGLIAYVELISAQSPDDLNFVIDLKNEQRYTPLHTSIFAKNLDAVKTLIANGADVDLKCHGTPPLHLALATAIQPNGEDFAFSCMSALLDASANVAAKDDHGCTIVHLAAEYNLPRFIVKALEYVVDVIDAVNSAPKLTGVTPLHRAARANSANSIRFLISCGSSIHSRTADIGMTPLHLAGAWGCASAWQALLQDVADVQQQLALLNEEDMLGRSPLELAKRSGWLPDSKDCTILVQEKRMCSEQNCKTFIVTNPLCTQHHTCPPSQVETAAAPPENSKRLHVLIDEQKGALCSVDLDDYVSWVRSSEPAALADVLRVHEWSYVRKVQERCAAITSADPEDEEEGFAHLDGDTAISCKTYKAALAAAGAVCQAVNLVAGSGSQRVARNAFCPVRPPGHHAGPKGVVKGHEPGASDSHGFCILNNVSIGAAYAMNQYRDTVKKVAIVDFDVHHGNGTEETVRWLQPRVETCPVNSTSGDLFGLMHNLAYKPWHSEQDSANVMFVSVHGYGPRERGMEHMMPMAAFYPGSGKTAIPEMARQTIPQDLKVEAEAHQSPSFSTSREKASAVAMEVEAEAPRLDNPTAIRSDSENDSDEDSNSSNNDRDGGSSYCPSMQSMGSMGSIYRRVSQARRMYSSFPIQQWTESSQQSVGCTRTGTTVLQAMPPLILDIGVQLPGAGNAEDRGKVLDELSYRIQWRKYFREMIFPRLTQFQPDIIFISAGFDAHKKDTINGGYIALIEDDFEWVTDKLVQLANSCCDGRIVSVLEGGYQLGGEHCSAFAQSAKAHVRSLCGGTRSRAEYSVDEVIAETALEEQHLQVLEELRQAQLLRKEQAREQAYITRMREREEVLQEHQLEQDQDCHIGGSKQVTVYDTPILSEESRKEEEASSGRKRRRQQVDYLALDKELRGQNK